MKKILGLAAIVLACASDLSANENVEVGDRYGFNPFLRRFFHIRDKNAAGTCPGQGAPAGYAGVGGPGMGGQGANPAQSGTLVFPNHPFVRSPRDFFQE